MARSFTAHRGREWYPAQASIKNEGLFFVEQPITVQHIREVCERFNEGLRCEREGSTAQNLSSFANSQGGVLVVGIRAVNGMPQPPFEGFAAQPREEYPLPRSMGHVEGYMPKKQLPIRKLNEVLRLRFELGFGAATFPSKPLLEHILASIAAQNRSFEKVFLQELDGTDCFTFEEFCVGSEAKGF